MDYNELKIENVLPDQQEILIPGLDEIGFESFSQEENELLAYIPVGQYREEKVKLLFSNLHLQFQVRTIKEKNWNEEWEKNYDPVVIAGECYVHASFHDPLPGIKYDILIEPRMSFGTAHHETTRLMIEKMLGMNITGKKVLDMGCGTAVLSILAHKMGAKEILAIDNDEWAFRNSLDNIAINGAGSIHVVMGDIDVNHSKDFDLIFSNINRNILLKHLCAYYNFLKKGGEMILSGFYTEDIPAIRNQAESFGFQTTGATELNNWVTLAFMK